MQTTFSVLLITDCDTSKEFYVKALGFKIDWEHCYGPDLPVFVQITKEGLSVYLSHHKGDCRAGGLAFFYVTDVDAWYNEYVGQGIVSSMLPRIQTWGNREMDRRDLLFSRWNANNGQITN